MIALFQGVRFASLGVVEVDPVPGESPMETKEHLLVVKTFLRVGRYKV